jgi:hypothetical protein
MRYVYDAHPMGLSAEASMLNIELSLLIRQSKKHDSKNSILLCHTRTWDKNNLRSEDDM